MQVEIGNSVGEAGGTAPSPPYAQMAGLDAFLPCALQVALSDPARAYLRDTEEAIIVFATFYAYPIASPIAQAYAVGQIYLE